MRAPSLGWEEPMEQEMVGSPRGRALAVGGSSSATPQPQVPGRLRWNRLCTLLRGPATAAARPGPLFRRSVSSGQVLAARGASTCQSRGLSAPRDPRAPAGASSGARRGMKYLKPWWSDGGSLFHLTILLSLAELRLDLDLDLDLDLYLLFPPRTLLGDELLLRNGQTSHISALSPFPASGGWGRAELLHPKCWERDPAAPPEGRLLREVRALGVPFIPSIRVDAWLVHSVATGDADGAHALLGAAAASSAGGVGAGVEGVSQAAPGGGGGPRAVQSSPLAAGEEEEKAPAERTAQVSDADGHASEVTGERDASWCWGTWPGALVMAGGWGGTPAHLHPSPPGRWGLQV